MELIVHERDDGVLFVQLKGDMNVQGAVELDNEFYRQVATRQRPTVIDMSGVAFISSLGMGMLAGCAASLQRRGKIMVLLNAQPDVAEAVRLAGIDQALPILDDEQEAITRVLGVAAG